jgi:hypothetical protein
MPLVELKTNLKNLKYSLDQPYGGSSGLPYIQTGIPKDPIVLRNPAVQGLRGDYLPIFRIGSTGNLDYPIRGGQIDFQLGDQTYTVSSQIDRIRIKKFFDDKPRGTAFIQKQTGLQLSNPKIETGNTLYGLGQTDPLPGLIENTRVYNRGINTLAQVAASGTGAHAIRHGLLPFNPFQKNYYAIVNQQNIESNSSNNRLVVLSELKMTSKTSKLEDIVTRKNVTNMNLVNNLGISLNRNLMFQYWGGPGSVYGVGTTTIKRAVDTTRLNSTISMTYDQLKKQTINKIIDGKYGQAETKIQDFREELRGLNGSYSSWGNTVDTRFYVSAGDYRDKMNYLSTFGFDNTTAPWQIDTQDPNKSTDDLIKFVFEAISNENNAVSTAIFFRAFLSAGITDNNAASLTTFKYMGRGEDFFTYQGFSRTISFSFKVLVGAEDELKPIYTKINALISQVYPDYSSKEKIMRAPIVRLTIGDYLYRVPGFLENVNITIDNNYPWELNLNNNKNKQQLPKVIDVNITFKPIMDELPQRTVYNGIGDTSGVALITNKFIDSTINKLNIKKEETPPPPTPVVETQNPEYTRRERRLIKRADKIYSKALPGQSPLKELEAWRKGGAKILNELNQIVSKLPD